MISRRRTASGLPSAVTSSRSLPLRSRSVTTWISCSAHEGGDLRSLGTHRKHPGVIEDTETQAEPESAEATVLVDDP